MTTKEVAEKIAANCISGNFFTNYSELYAEDVVRGGDLRGD